jgi:hypothetical protein
MDDNQLDIVLRFLVDENSKQKALNTVNSVSKSAAGSSVLPATAPLADTYAQQRDGLDDLRNQFTQARADADDFADRLQRVQTGWNAGNPTQRGVEDLSRGLRRAIEDNEKLQYVFTRVGVAGAAILGPMVLSANRYVQEAGAADSVSRTWLQSTDRLSNAQLRVGRVIAQEILPALEAAASLAEKIADLSEQHPELVRAGLATGSILATVGAVGSLYTTAKGVMARVALLSAGTSAAGAAATGTAAAGAGGLASAGATGALLAVAAGLTALPALLGRSLGQKLGTWQAAENLGTQAYDAVRRALGLMGDQATQSAGQINAAAGSLRSQAQTDAFIGYQQQETEAAQQYESQRLQIVNDYGRQRAEAEANYENQRAEIIANYKSSLADESASYARQTANAARSYYQAEVQAEQDYYRQRTKLAQSYSLEVQRAEQDHQRRMLEMQADHALRVEDLLDNQDAFGLLSEMRSYEKNRSQAEGDYAVDSARRSQDFSLRLAEMENEFAQTRARRQADYAQQRADAEVEYGLRNEQRQKQMEQQLKALDAQYKAETARAEQQQADKLQQLRRQAADEQQARYTAFANQMRDLNAYLGQETDLRSQYYTYWGTQFETFMQANLDAMEKLAYPTTSGTKLPGRAAGGYVGAGLYQTGEEGYEYVLSHKTTAALEKMSGSKLSQGKVLNLLGGNSGQVINYYDQRRIDGRVSAADKRELRNDNLDFFKGALA